MEMLKFNYNVEEWYKHSWYALGTGVPILPGYANDLEETIYFSW